MKKRHLSFRHSHSSSDPSTFFLSPWNLFTQIFIWINPARHGLLLSYSWDREVCVCCGNWGRAAALCVYKTRFTSASINQKIFGKCFLPLDEPSIFVILYKSKLLLLLSWVDWWFKKKKYEAKCTREWINKKSVHPFQPTAKKTNSIGDVFLLTQLDSSCCLSVCLSVQI